MDMQQLTDKDLELRKKYYKLCAEQSTFRPKIGEDLVADIIEFLKELVDNGPVIVELREDYYWLNMSYHQWCRYLNDRGVELGDLPSIFPEPQNRLRPLRGNVEDRDKT